MSFGNEALRRARAIRLLTCDVDGVLTDGRLYYDQDGRQLKAFSVRDGLWLKLLMNSGVAVAWITGSRAPCVTRRAEDLGIARVIQGSEDKLPAWTDLREELGIAAAEVAHIGDDLPDLPVLRRCGLAMSVPGAPAVVRANAHHVTAGTGGYGAVHEACELLMQAQGTLGAQLARFLR